MLKQKICALLLMVVILVLLCGTSVYPYSETESVVFTDIQWHWAREQIMELARMGVVSGRGDGSFDPEGKVTRAEMCVMINKAFGFVRHEYITFDDISPLDFYFQEVSIAVCAGYMTGYDDNTVRPNDNITRAEAAAIFSQLIEFEPRPGSVDGLWDGANVPEWALSYVEAVVAHGIMNIYGDSSFRHWQHLTRAEAASSIYAALTYVPDRLVIVLDRNYGPVEGVEIIDGDVVIAASGITLQNLIITGDLIILQSIGAGSFSLINVLVEGEAYVELEEEEDE